MREAGGPCEPFLEQTNRDGHRGEDVGRNGPLSQMWPQPLWRFFDEVTFMNVLEVAKWIPRLLGPRNCIL